MVNKRAIPQHKNYDIVISGGGVVGCLAALALARHTSFSVLLVEARGQIHQHSPQNKNIQASHQGFDARVIALASESINLLLKLGVDIRHIAHENIKHIHVSDRGHLGQVSLDAKDYALDYLGKVVAIESLGEYLLGEYVSETKNNKKLDYVCPSKIEKIITTESDQSLYLSNDVTLKAKLLLVSDGGQSNTASLAGISSLKQDYTQSAIITNVITQLPHHNIAYERFTSQGPIAFLPMYHDDSSVSCMSVVWCMNKDKIQDTLALDDKAFLDKLQYFFGHKLGKLLSCSQKHTYPLALIRSESFVKHRSICIGNAAQSLHPIAGQGFNLGIRDVYDLIRVVKDENDAGSFALTSAYRQARASDKNMTVDATDTLLRVFSNQYEPVVGMRNIALLTMNKSNVLKASFAKFAMGKRTYKEKL